MTAESVTIAEAKAGACYYVLLILLQRLDPLQPGLIDGMLQGATADFATIESNGMSSELLLAVQREVRQLLEHAATHRASVHPQGGA